MTTGNIFVDILIAALVAFVVGLLLGGQAGFIAFVVLVLLIVVVYFAGRRGNARL